MALQGSVMDWVADHRKHHAHTDEEGDPHSPHVGHGSGLRGLWHAHTGWLFETHGQADWKKYAKDLYEDRGMRRIGKAFPYLALYSLVLPTLLGFILHGFTAEGALRGLIWGGLVRAFFLHHVTWSINSICHFFGRRRFELADRSTNVAWLALPSLGEAWHHNHHAFPRSAGHGLRGWERAMDPSAWLIALMERLGLAWNVVRISPERQEARASRPRVVAYAAGVPHRAAGKDQRVPRARAAAARTTAASSCRAPRGRPEAARGRPEAARGRPEAARPRSGSPPSRAAARSTGPTRAARRAAR
jgi:stearoyl-CoA desaturase (delta-9 desaturase)